MPEVFRARIAPIGPFARHDRMSQFRVLGTALQTGQRNRKERKHDGTSHRAAWG